MVAAPEDGLQFRGFVAGPLVRPSGERSQGRAVAVAKTEGLRLAGQSQSAHVRCRDPGDTQCAGEDRVERLNHGCGGEFCARVGVDLVRYRFRRFAQTAAVRGEDRSLEARRAEVGGKNHVISPIKETVASTKAAPAEAGNKLI